MRKSTNHDERPLVFRTKRRGKPRKFLPGQVHGVLELVEFAGYRDGTTAMWRCRCQRCGAETLAYQTNFYRRPARCPECPRFDQPSWNRWRKMVRRCHDPESTQYRSYGGQGIEVCDRWRESIEDFCRDMGQPPKGKPYIGRHDPTGPYSPENCFWTEVCETQQTNPHNRMVTIGNLTLRSNQWAALCGISRERMRQRFNKFPAVVAIAPYPGARWAVEQAGTEAVP